MNPSKSWSFAHRESGVFSGARFSGPEHLLGINCPSGYIPVMGQHDHNRVRVDIATGDLVEYQPPAPPADDWQTWAWDADAWRWVSVPTAAALARQARAERDRRLLACDWTQQRDVPAATAQAWVAYRQALRDISTQPGFPGVIQWPEEPAP